jgi:SAM-dependent methyltransferase
LQSALLRRSILINVTHIGKLPTMGRFASTAALYEEFRAPYPAEFFLAVARELSLSKAHALIDLGTGPALIALGFAPYVGRVVAVDPEPAMIAAARRAEARAAKGITLIEGKAEALPTTIGTFDIVTIGRALHWLDPKAIIPLFQRLVAPGGVIAVCASGSVTDGRNPWLDTYNDARRFWSQSNETGRHHDLASKIFEDSPFKVTKVIKIESTQALRASELAKRVLTFSSSSPEVLGNKVEPMLGDVEHRLAPFAVDGVLTDIVVSTAQIARAGE